MLGDVLRHSMPAANVDVRSRSHLIPFQRENSDDYGEAPETPSLPRLQQPCRGIVKQIAPLSRSEECGILVGDNPTDVKPRRELKRAGWWVPAIPTSVTPGTCVKCWSANSPNPPHPTTPNRTGLSCMTSNRMEECRTNASCENVTAGRGRSNAIVLSQSALTSWCHHCVIGKNPIQRFGLAQKVTMSLNRGPFPGLTSVENGGGEPARPVRFPPSGRRATAIISNRLRDVASLQTLPDRGKTLSPRMRHWLLRSLSPEPGQVKPLTRSKHLLTGSHRMSSII